MDQATGPLQPEGITLRAYDGHGQPIAAGALRFLYCSSLEGDPFPAEREAIPGGVRLESLVSEWRAGGRSGVGCSNPD